MKVITVSAPEAFNHMFYPEQHPGTLQYIENQFNTIGNNLTEFRRQFMEESKKMVRDFYDNNIARAARAATRMVDNLLHPNSIRQYRTLEDIQAATPVMQRWMMAMPELHEKHHQQLASGYAGSYHDPEPGRHGPDNYDWRRVNHGVIHDTEDGGYHYQWFFEDLHEGDRELTVEDRIAIINTWDLARMFMANGQDPSNPFGGEIG